MANKKKKYKYVKEHTLTIENLRVLIGMFLLGLVVLGLCGLSWYNIFTSDCCLMENQDCSFASGLGMFVWVIATIIFSAIGLICMVGIFLDESGPEIKVRKEIK